MRVNITLDLDGTVFDLYGKEDWLYRLENHIAGAFEGSMLPEVDKKQLSELAEKLLEIGVGFDVVTWLPMGATKEYEWICQEEKLEWCRVNLPFIKSIKCVPYGTPKQSVARGAGRMYLIDDNSQICDEWETKVKRKAFNVNADFTIVNALEKIYKELTA